MAAWQLVDVPKTTASKPRGLTITITSQTDKVKGYIYFSAGLNMKEGKYNMFSKNGVYGFVEDESGRYQAKRKQSGSSVTMSDRSILVYLREKLKLDKNKCYKYLARIEDGVIVLDPSKLIYD